MTDYPAPASSSTPTPADVKPAAAREERKAYLREAIAGITQQLKGPGISPVERLMLHEDRKDMRRELGELE